MTAQSVPAAPYRPRWFSELGIWEAGPLALKAYSIRRDSSEDGPSNALQQSAKRRLVESTAAGELESHHGLGFAILHEGEEGVWLLMDWWAHTDICCQRLFHRRDASTTFKLVDRPLMACVWESVIQSYERQAWVDTMLTATPDPGRYMARRLPDGPH